MIMDVIIHDNGRLHGGGRSSLRHKAYSCRGLCGGDAAHSLQPTVKQHLAALRMLFDWLVTGHVIETNPAHAVRSPRYVVTKGKTPVLAPDEARALLGSIPTASLLGLRDRALIGVMVYTFARVNAVIRMKVK